MSALCVGMNKMKETSLSLTQAAVHLFCRSIMKMTINKSSDIAESASPVFSPLVNEMRRETKHSSRPFEMLIAYLNCCIQQKLTSSYHGFLNSFLQICEMVFNYSFERKVYLRKLRKLIHYNQI